MFTDTESLWIMANKQYLHKLLSDAIPVVCRNGLPPSVSFRVEALIGITVVDDGGREVVGEGSVTVLSFQQTVSGSGVIASQFGANNPTAVVSDVRSIVSHTPRNLPAPKQTPATRFTMAQEYAIETSMKQEYGAESYPSCATGHRPVDNTPEGYGAMNGADVECMSEDSDNSEDEECYVDGGRYSDDGSDYPSDVKIEEPDDSYMESASFGSYMPNEYVTKDREGHSSTGSPPKSKAARPRLSAAGAQPGTSRGRKPGGAGRGRTKPRAGKTSRDRATGRTGIKPKARKKSDDQVTALTV